MLSRSRHLLGAFAVALIVVPASTPVAFADCAQNERIGGSCSAITAETGEQEVTLSRTESTSGTPGGQESTSGVVSYSPVDPPPIRTEAELGSDECEIKVAGLCRAQAPEKATGESSQITTPPEAPTHVSELQAFRPNQPGIVMEPDGWSLPTLEVNLVSTATRHRVSGELLGWPVVVRFTPARFRWSYGDGQSARLSAAGSTNSSAGRAQFDQSPTSHRYEKPGSYLVSLRVDYDVEFKFDGGTFNDLDGQVHSSASSRRVEVFSVSPLLTGE